MPPLGLASDLSSQTPSSSGRHQKEPGVLWNLCVREHSPNPSHRCIPGGQFGVDPTDRTGVKRICVFPGKQQECLCWLSYQDPSTKPDWKATGIWGAVIWAASSPGTGGKASPSRSCTGLCLGLWSTRSWCCTEPSVVLARGLLPSCTWSGTQNMPGEHRCRESPHSSPGDGDAGGGVSWLSGQDAGTLQEPGIHCELEVGVFFLVSIFRRASGTFYRLLSRQRF